MNATISTITDNIRALAWVRSGYAVNAWKLVCRGRTFATMAFLEADQSRALLQTDAGAWEIEASLTDDPARIALRRADSTHETAAVRPASSGNARIDFFDAVSFRWRGPATAACPASIVTLKGGSLITVGKPIGAHPTALTVELAEGASAVPELGALLGLGLFLALHQQEGTLSCEWSPALEDTAVMAG